MSDTLEERASLLAGPYQETMGFPLPVFKLLAIAQARAHASLVGGAVV